MRDAREPIDDLDHIASGGSGWGDGIFAHGGCIGRPARELSTFSAVSVRIPSDGEADARSGVRDGNRQRRRPAAGRARRSARAGRHRRGRRRCARGRARRRVVPRRCHGYRCLAGIRRRRGGGARRPRLRLVERRRADRRVGRGRERGRLRSLVRDQRARARGRVRCRGAPPARGRRRCDLHHGVQLRAALGAADRSLRGHEGRGARARAPGRARLRQRGDPRQRALPGLDRHALQHARLGELRRPRALPRRGAAARAAGSHRHAPRRRGGWPASCSPTTRRT